MKISLILIGGLLLLLNENPNIEEIYVYREKGVFNSIDLKNDKTFLFTHRNSQSCWTWFNYKGSWTQNKDTIVLIDTIKRLEERIIIEEKKEDTNNNKIEVILLDENKVPIEKQEIKLKSGNKIENKITDETGKLYFTQNFYNPEEERILQIKYSDDIVEISSNSIIKSNTNQIRIIFNKHPKEKLIERVNKYLIRNANLISFANNWFDGNVIYSKGNREKLNKLPDGLKAENGRIVLDKN